MKENPVSTFLAAIESATVDQADIYADDAELDATVPNWRMHVQGGSDIRAEYARWFDHPVTFTSLERIPIADGELVIYEHEWVTDGVRHRGHHSHRIVVRGDKIAADHVWCGGKWPEPLLNDMELVDH